MEADGADDWTVVADELDGRAGKHELDTKHAPVILIYNHYLYWHANVIVGYDDEDIVFKFTVAGPVENGWGLPNGLSIEIFDIYMV